MNRVNTGGLRVRQLVLIDIILIHLQLMYERIGLSDYVSQCHLIQILYTRSSRQRTLTV